MSHYLIRKSYKIIQNEYIHNLLENDGWNDEAQKEEEYKHLIRKINIQ